MDKKLNYGFVTKEYINADRNNAIAALNELLESLAFSVEMGWKADTTLTIINAYWKVLK